MTSGRLRAAVITASDRSARGEREDAGGPALGEVLEAAGVEVAVREVHPDERPVLAARLRHLADRERLDLVVVTGGTGLGPRDVTPEAIRDVIDREVPGLGEAMRQEGRRKTPFALLSRSLAGVRGRTLILGVPGNPKGARESLEAVLPVLCHARDMLAGGDHPADGEAGPAAPPAPPVASAAGMPGTAGERLPPVVAVVGWSGSGKTTLMEKLLGELTRRGYRVGTLKHDAHGFEMDRPGKDTWRHRRAGAAAVAINAPGGFGLIAAAETPLERAVALLDAAAGPLDLVLIEGYKAAPYPKISVYRAARGGEPCCAGDPLVLAFATDTPLDVAGEQVPLDDAARLADRIEGRVLRAAR